MLLAAKLDMRGLACNICLFYRYDAVRLTFDVCVTNHQKPNKRREKITFCFERIMNLNFNAKVICH